MKKNEAVKIEITGLNSEGAGVGRVNGEVVFVPYALPGETVEALIIKAAKNYSVGKLLSVAVTSDDRVEPKCPYFFRCGGCDFQHLNYDAQLKYKCEAAIKNINKLSGLSLKIKGTVPSSQIWGYRTKAQFPISQDKTGAPVLGFFSSHSHSVVSIDGCLLQDEQCNSIIGAVKKALAVSGVSVYDEHSHNGILRHAVARKGKNGLMVIFVTNGKKNLPRNFIEAFLKSAPNVTTVIQNINTSDGNIILGSECRTLFGSGFIEDRLCGIRFNLRPLAFLQVNPYQTERLYSIVSELAGLTGVETVFDAYCGIGIMSLMLAKRAAKVVGVEIVPEAIATAEESAQLNGISNAEFFTGACEDILPKLLSVGNKPDILVVDPPRAGCEASLIEAVAASDIRKVIYVSCNPATLARDLGIFASLGYSAEEVTFVDMFGHTKHVETVVLMSRNKG